MNTILIILLVIGIIIALLLAVAYFSSEEYSIEQEIIVNKPKHQVFEYIRVLKNSDNFNKWVMMDSAMKKTYTGTDGTVGFVYSWDSENKQVGKGEQEIIKIKDGERIDYELRFYKPFEGKANAWLNISSLAENQTKVQWVFSGLRNYPMRIMHIVLNLKKALGKDLQTSLISLKNVLEK
ncbi:MAG TPA: SRPBCC family protein [Cyclobacteriaceae bacterium]|nr:SRPBCC family protein [Cyclobacteriaceae bacterium]